MENASDFFDLTSMYKMSIYANHENEQKLRQMQDILNLHREQIKPLIEKMREVYQARATGQLNMVQVDEAISLMQEVFQQVPELKQLCEQLSTANHLKQRIAKATQSSRQQQPTTSKEYQPEH